MGESNRIFVYPIAFFCPQGHEAHYRWGHPERPERVEVIRRALTDAGLWQVGLQVEPEKIPDEIMQTVHSQELLEAVRNHSERQQDFDLDTYLTKESWRLALNAAGGAAALARAVWGREANVGFALTRPPGHHTTRDQSMGFCLLNNIAIAAETLIQTENANRLAIVDMDVHHGNGTQEFFWKRGDVLFISTHQSPLYPGTGQLNERGSGDGEGATFNLPLPPFSGDQAFHLAYGEIVPALLDHFQPEMIMVSFGFDSHWKDPLANLMVSAHGYGEAIKSLKRWADRNCEGRIAVFLEGGYDLEAAVACGLAVTQALLGMEITDAVGPPPQPESESWLAVLNKAKEIWHI
ncbi:MAG: histone deacetylase [Chloroflexi bacterium]|nr:histone deacetylase [Chloroflexota bacterium]